MNYLISKFDCFINEFNMEIKKNIKYLFNLENKNYLFFGKNCELPIYVNFFKATNVLKLNYKNNNYFILFPQKFNDVSFVKIKFLNNEYCITISNNLNITTDKENILNEEIEKLTYSHYVVIGNILVIYFLGLRNYVVIIQNEKVLAASYYDEYNENQNEILFLYKFYDSLNHGKVFKIKNKIFEEYLVYLDDCELKLKPRFICFTFLDCLYAGNLKYCNELLSEEVKQKESENIKNFFTEFDFYFELEENVFAFIKKDTLRGIFKFETNNLKITNIIPLVQQLF